MAAQTSEGLTFLPLRNGFWRRLFRLRPVEPLPFHIIPRRIYILPTRQGLVFALLLLGMLIGAMNYSLSMGYLFTFLWAGMLLSALLATWRTLLGITLDHIEGEPGFAGEQVGFTATFRVPEGRDLAGIVLEGSGVDIPFEPVQAGLARARLLVAARQRGAQPLGPCRIYTEAPLGLFRAWALCAPAAIAPVWPRPVTKGLPLPASAGNEEDQSHGSQRGAEDFDGLGAYHPGESPSRLVWKSLARLPEPLVKQFVAPQGGSLWLDWNLLPGLETEARLSHLARWVLDADLRRLTYGLRLPGLRISPASGPVHRLRCLNALALHGVAKGGNHG